MDGTDSSWNTDPQFELVVYKGETYYAIHGVHPKDIRGVSKNRDRNKYGGPAIVVNPKDPIYSEKCINKFDKTSLNDLSFGYNGFSVGRYQCVKKAVFSANGPQTEVIHSVLLVPTKYRDNLMSSLGGRSGQSIRGNNLKYDQYMQEKSNIEVWLRKNFVKPLQLNFTVSVKAEKEDFGF
mgnify:CR=1 FL=1